MLSSKAQKLLQALQKRGGGALDEYFLRDDTGLSHGSIVAARRELTAAGLLTLRKQGRRLAYELGTPKTANNSQPTPSGNLSADSQPVKSNPLTFDQLTATTKPAVKAPPAGGVASPAPPLTQTDTANEPPPAPKDIPLTDAAETMPSDTARADASFLPAMPHIAGTFYDFDEWTDALMNALGACIYISESLTCDGTYTVYSHEYESEDMYQTEMTEDGFIVQ